jgi:hypothetical protein
MVDKETIVLEAQERKPQNHHGDGTTPLCTIQKSDTNCHGGWNNASCKKKQTDKNV